MKPNLIAHARIPSLTVASIVMLSPCGSPAMASVTLACHIRYGDVALQYVTVDYQAGTVATTDVNSLTLLKDDQGRTAIPATITDSEIDWNIPSVRGDGLVYAQHFKVSRLTGNLSWYDDGMKYGAEGTCEVGQAAPKF